MVFYYVSDDIFMKIEFDVVNNESVKANFGNWSTVYLANIDIRNTGIVLPFSI